MNLPFMLMNMGGGMGGMMNQQQQQPAAPNEGDFPIRIQKAMEYVHSLNQATMNRYAVTDVSVQEIPGRELTAEECDVRDSALKIIRDYFDGKLRPDQWEAMRYEYQHAKIAQNNAVTAAARSVATSNTGKVMHCPNCEGPGNVGCPLCAGTAQVVVSPLRTVEEQQPAIPQRHPELEGMPPATEPTAVEGEAIGGACVEGESEEQIGGA